MNKVIKKLLSLTFALCMIVVILTAGAVTSYAVSDPSTYTFDISEGAITISQGTTSGIKVSYGNNQVEDDIPAIQQITIIGTSTTDGVTVTGVSANISIDNVNIDVSAIDNACAFNMTGSTVNLTLLGTTTLQSGANKAGLQVPAGSTLMIAGTGTLTSAGGKSGAGIGGGNGESGGTITITSGTITAYGKIEADFRGGAGIGSGNYSVDGGNITITGGVIMATGGNDASGIGGGSSGNEGNMGNGGNITITGGVIIATGNSSGAGIGGGLLGSGGNIVITGGTVIAACGDSGYGYFGSGAGIGGGGGTGMTKSGASGTIIITGTANVTATGGSNPDQGGGAGIGSGGSGELHDVGASVGAAGDGSNPIIITVSITATGGTGINNRNGANIGSGGGGSTAGTEVTPISTVTNHTITATVGTGGNISPAGTVSAVEHENAVFTVTADSCYMISSITVNGAPQSISNTKQCTFIIPNVTGNASVQVTFAIDPSATHTSGGAADCTTPETCTVCSYQISPALGHDWDMSNWANDTTHHWHACNNGCNERNSEAVHTSGGSADCTTPETCTVCSYQISPALGHDWDMSNWVNDTTHHWHACNNGCNERNSEAVHTSGGAAACTTAETCTVCSYQISPALDHDWGEWIETTPATITTKGVETRICANCGAAETRDIPKLTTHMIIATAKAGGTITPAGIVQTVEGKNQTFKISANSGYRILDVKVDGVSIGAVSEYIFTSVKKSHTIEATFTSVKETNIPFTYIIVPTGPIYYTVTFETNGGSIIPSQSVSNGNTAVIPEIPTKDGYEFAGWYTTKALTKEYDFKSAVTGNITLYAKWTEVIEPITNTSNQPVVTEPAPQKWNNPFVDVSETDWFYGDVEYVYTNDIFRGTSDTTFSPDMPITRAMVVTVLWRMTGSPVIDGTPFTDVPSGQYYSESVAWAEANGIVMGIGDNLFSPDMEITREQMVTILWRYAKFIGIDVSSDEGTDISSYNDADDVSEYAITAMKWASGAGILSGKSNNLLDSQRKATRAEVSSMLHRLPEPAK